MPLFIGNRIVESLSARASHVVHADGCDRLDPVVNLRRADRITAAATSAQHADTILIHKR